MNLSLALVLSFLLSFILRGYDSTKAVQTAVFLWTLRWKQGPRYWFPILGGQAGVHSSARYGLWCGGLRRAHPAECLKDVYTLRYWKWRGITPCFFRKQSGEKIKYTALVFVGDRLACLRNEHLTFARSPVCDKGQGGKACALQRIIMYFCSFGFYAHVSAVEGGVWG